MKITESLTLSLLTLSNAIESRDPYTGGHCWRVCQFTRLLGKQMQLSDKDIAQAALGAYMHDIGKISIPDHILNKPGKLTPQEYGVVKEHAVIGKRMVASHPLAPLVEDIIWLHHERPDGKGYPEGLVENDIPVMAKIVGVCDAFDAMTSDRPYRKGKRIDDALSILESNSGEQFCADTVDAFLKIPRAQLEDIVQHSDWGYPLQSCPTCGITVVIPKYSEVGDEVFCPVCKLGDEVTAINTPHKHIELEANNKVVGVEQVSFPYDEEILLELMSEIGISEIELELS